MIASVIMTMSLYQDVMVLNDIIDQVSERPMSKATHLSSAFQVEIHKCDIDDLYHDGNIDLKAHVHLRMTMMRGPR